ncbi:MAG TPA: hypothetical protein VML36_02860 [Nitrospiria bacterium]|nr:hypothetical protein [Nitrospiria bacterium]
MMLLATAAVRPGQYQRPCVGSQEAAPAVARHRADPGRRGRVMHAMMLDRLAAGMRRCPGR